MTEPQKSFPRSLRIALLIFGWTCGAVVAALSGAAMGERLRVQEAELREGVAPQIMIGGVRG